MEKSVLVVFGTRPEVIKLSPLIRELKSLRFIKTYSLNSGQHRDMVEPVLEFFDIFADITLNIMKPEQSLSDLLAHAVRQISNAIQNLGIDLIIVHGDTTTTLAASLVGYNNKIKVAHIEAGLRTGDIYSPWPEEGNRKIVTSIAQWHFAPTEASKNNLVSENVLEKNIFVVGNTAIDAIEYTKNSMSYNSRAQKITQRLNLVPGKKIVLVTGHRRESFGQGFKNICKALNEIVKLHKDVYVIYPVHLNPNVRKAVEENIILHKRLKIVEPMGYSDFSTLMQMSYLILTDSGGIQEEAPSLDKPVLVMRETTERPEGVSAGCLRLVGTSINSIIHNTSILLTDDLQYKIMKNAKNPYGDGKSSSKIAKIIEDKIVNES